MKTTRAYRVLGVDGSADEEEIKCAYRKKVKQYHPDTSKLDQKVAEEKFKEVKEAYEVLAGGNGAKDLPPRPVIDHGPISFTGASPGEAETTTFTVRNEGGPANGFRMLDRRANWLNVVRLDSVNNSSTFPLEVEIEAIGRDWASNYKEKVGIEAGGNVAWIPVKLSTAAKPKSTRGTSTGSGKSQSGRGGNGGSGQKNKTKSATGGGNSSSGYGSGLWGLDYGWEVSGLLVAILAGLGSVAGGAGYLVEYPEEVQAGVAAILAGLVLFGLASYSAYRTSWLRDLKASSFGTRFWTGTSVTCGLVLIGAAIAAVAAAVFMGWLMLTFMFYFVAGMFEELS